MKVRYACRVPVSLRVVCLFLFIAIANQAAAGGDRSRGKAEKVGIHSLTLLCQSKPANGRTTDVLVSNSGKKTAEVIFEYRKAAGKDGRLGQQSGLRYLIAPQQSLSLDCDDLLTENDQTNESLSMAVSAQPFDGISVLATYSSKNNDSTCTAQVLPIDRFEQRPNVAAGKYCSECPPNSNGICCAGVCCEGDCVDGSCKASSFSILDIFD